MQHPSKRLLLVGPVTLILRLQPEKVEEARWSGCQGKTKKRKKAKEKQKAPPRVNREALGASG